MILFLTVVLRKIRLSVTRKVCKTAVPASACLLFSMDRFHTEHSTRVCLFTLTVSCDNLRGSCYRIQQDGTGSYRIMPDSVMLWQVPTVFLAILFAKIF